MATDDDQLAALLPALQVMEQRLRAVEIANTIIALQVSASPEIARHLAQELRRFADDQDLSLEPLVRSQLHRLAGRFEGSPEARALTEFRGLSTPEDLRAAFRVVGGRGFHEPPDDTSA